MEYNDGIVRVRRYRGERVLPQCIIQRHTARTPGIMVRGAIGYDCRSHLVHIEGNLNSDRYIREIVEPEVLPLLQSIPGAIFQQDNTRVHVSHTVQAFFSTQYCTVDALHCVRAAISRYENPPSRIPTMRPRTNSVICWYGFLCFLRGILITYLTFSTDRG